MFASLHFENTLSIPFETFILLFDALTVQPGVHVEYLTLIKYEFACGIIGVYRIQCDPVFFQAYPNIVAKYYKCDSRPGQYVYIVNELDMSVQKVDISKLDTNSVLCSIQQTWKFFLNGSWYILSKMQSGVTKHEAIASLPTFFIHMENPKWEPNKVLDLFGRYGGNNDNNSLSLHFVDKIMFTSGDHTDMIWRDRFALLGVFEPKKR